MQFAGFDKIIHGKKQPPEVFNEKGFLKIFRKILWKTLVPQSVSIKSWRPHRLSTLLKKDSGTAVFL